jgi:hypothetical protein
MPAWLTTLFGSPWMLAWLPAAAVPVLIHLWNRRKFREVQWAAMQYLLAAISKSTRRMRIEQLLLLAVRTLLILLAVLALAEPFLSAVASPLVRSARTHRVLVLDGSYSMAYRFGEKRAFEMAQEAAIQIVEDGNEGDAYSLILMADTPRIVVGTAAYDREEFIREIRNLRLPHGGADLPAALRATHQLVRQVRKDQKQLQRHHVYFLTDMGHNTWAGDRRGEVEEKDFLQLLEQLADEKHGLVEVMPLGTSAVDNLAVTQLTTSTAYATLGRTVRVQASIRSFRTDKSRHAIEFWIDGRRVDQQTIDVLPGDETPPVVFDYKFPSPGDHALEVRIDGDPLQIDNRRYLILPVKEHLDALLVSGKRGSTLPLEAALDGGDFQRGLRGTIRPHVVAESALLELEMNRYDCIFLCNVGQFTADEALVLRRYLEQGGGLITILGDQVQADRYNRELSGTHGEPRVLPARLGETFSDGKYHYFDPLDYQHSLMTRWRGKPKSGLTNVPVLKFFRLHLPDSAEARIALGLDTGDPLIVEQTIARGRSILLATDVSTASGVVTDQQRRPWSLIASWLNSQPFLESLWQAAVGGKIDDRNVLVGETVSAPFETTAGDAHMVISPPEGPTDGSRMTAQADASGWSFTETEFSGIYSAQISDASRTARKFAVNVNTDESDLQRVRPEDLPATMLLSGSGTSVPLAKSAGLGSSGFTLHQWLLCAVLGLLFLETFLAWWIGHRSA